MSGVRLISIKTELVFMFIFVGDVARGEASGVGYSYMLGLKMLNMKLE